MSKTKKVILKEFVAYLNKTGDFHINQFYIDSYLKQNTRKKRTKIPYRVLVKGRVEFIQNFISDLEKLYRLDFASKNRIRETVVARAIVANELYSNPIFRIDDTKLTLTVIGDYLGGYDHATITHYFKKIQDWQDTKDTLYFAMYGDFVNFMQCNLEYLKEKHNIKTK